MPPALYGMTARSLRWSRASAGTELRAAFVLVRLASVGVPGLATDPAVSLLRQLTIPEPRPEIPTSADIRRVGREPTSSCIGGNGVFRH